MTKQKPIQIKVEKAGWYAVKDGKRLTAQQTARLISQGTPYAFQKKEG